MVDDLQQLNSLVTGGLRGIGKGIAQALKERGDNVFIFDILPPDHKQSLLMIKEGFNYLQVDVSSVDSIKNGFVNLFNELKKITNKDLNLLVNNAGVTRDGLAVRLKESDWDDVLHINLKGSFFCIQQALKKMIRQKISYIINISSIVGIIGNIGQAHYSASKSGLIAITKSLAAEYGQRNILINSIAPGFIQTDMTENLSKITKEKILDRISLRRFGTTGEVANLVLFLSSGNANYITGQTICLDGGFF